MATEQNSALDRRLGFAPDATWALPPLVLSSADVNANPDAAPKELDVGGKKYRYLAPASQVVGTGGSVALFREPANDHAPRFSTLATVRNRAIRTFDRLDRALSPGVRKRWSHTPSRNLASLKSAPVQPPSAIYVSLRLFAKMLERMLVELAKASAPGLATPLKRLSPFPDAPNKRGMSNRTRPAQKEPAAKPTPEPGFNLTRDFELLLLLAELLNSPSRTTNRPATATNVTAFRPRRNYARLSQLQFEADAPRPSARRRRPASEPVPMAA